MTNNLIGITARYEEIIERVRNGTLDEARVEQMLEVIMDGTSALSAPDWWRTAQQQLERAHRLWPQWALPEPPKRFTPATASEILLLHVPDTIESLWNKVIAGGYSKHCMDMSEHALTLTYGRWEYTQPVWLGFDPKHGVGVSPESLWGQNNLAASEVLSALIQFPDWYMQWHREGSPTPHMSGYVLENRGHLYVPTFFRWDERKRLCLGDHWAVKESDYHASPSIRELPS